MPTSMPTYGPQPLAVMANPAAPHFAGGGSALQRMGNGTIKLFDAINKNNLYQFFALDVVALWITRIVTGLAVGRIAVNALNEANPAAKADNPFQLWRHDLAENIKGLNWGNSWEILKREGLQGPGSLLLPTVAYGATRWLTRTHIQDMNYGWLQKLHLAFQSGASASGALADTPTIPQLVKNAVNQFFTPMTANDKLAQLRALPLLDTTMLRQMPRAHISLDVPDTRTLEAVLKPYGTNPIKTVGEFLDHWTHRYATQVDSIIKEHGGDRLKAKKELTHLAHTLGDDLDAVWRGVTRHNGNALQHVVHEGAMPLRELRAQPPLFRRQQQLHVIASIKETSLSTFSKSLGQFADYWLDVLPKPAAKPSVGELLSKAGAYVNKVTRIKGLITVVGMIIGASWAYFLPHLTQSSKSYPAARLFKQAGAPMPEATAPQPVLPQGPSALATLPLQPMAGIPNGMPNFSQWQRPASVLGSPFVPSRNGGLMV